MIVSVEPRGLDLDSGGGEVPWWKADMLFIKEIFEIANMHKVETTVIPLGANYFSKSINTVQ